MELPYQLQAALDKEFAAPAGRQLHRASGELSARYRAPTRSATFMTTDAHRLAYLAARLPATYAAVKAVLGELLEREPGIDIKSLLDMGAGPATALWAAAQLFPDLAQATLIEQDGDLITLAKRLLEDSPCPAPVWKHLPMQRAQDLAPHDLVMFSYSINELPEDEQLPLIEKAWQLTQKALIVIEPGTPAGFERIRRIRACLIEKGAFLVAPCPNALPCPMAGTDWCHFAVRLERSSEHRQAKGASMGYEDEKYSYLIAGKMASLAPRARILRHPQKHSGHLSLSLCTEGVVANRTLSRRDGDIYKQARKLEWGDPFPKDVR